MICWFTADLAKRFDIFPDVDIKQKIQEDLLTHRTWSKTSCDLFICFFGLAMSTKERPSHAARLFFGFKLHTWNASMTAQSSLQKLKKYLNPEKYVIYGAFHLVARNIREKVVSELD